MKIGIDRIALLLSLCLALAATAAPTAVAAEELDKKPQDPVGV